MQCKEPSLKGSTISDLVRHIVELRESVDECNNRMSTIDKSLDEYDRRYNRDTEISGDVNSGDANTKKGTKQGASTK